MRRYCVLDDCTKIKFQAKDKMFGLDVNFKKNVLRIMSEQEQFEFNYEDIGMRKFRQYIYDERNRSYIDNFLEFVNRIYESYECELDVLEEMILILSLLNREKNLLYEPKRLCGVDFSIYKAKIRDSIKNLNKDKIGKNKIFDVTGIKNAKIDTRIDSFGRGIIEMWLLQSKFRNLFVSTALRNEKYEKKNIFDTLDDAGVIFKEDDCVIWEKLLSIRLSINFQEWILPFFMTEKNELTVTEKALEELLEAIMKYEGQHICCAMVQMIGCQLQTVKKMTPSLLDESILELFTFILKNNFEKSNLLYKTIVKDMLEKYSQFFTVQTTLEMINMRRNEIHDVGYPCIRNNWVWRELEAERFAERLDCILRKYRNDCVAERLMQIVYEKKCRKKCRKKCESSNEIDCPYGDVEWIADRLIDREAIEKARINDVARICQGYNTRFGLSYADMSCKEREEFRYYLDKENVFQTKLQKKIIDINYKKYETKAEKWQSIG